MTKEYDDGDNNNKTTSFLRARKEKLIGVLVAAIAIAGLILASGGSVPTWQSTVVSAQESPPTTNETEQEEGIPEEEFMSPLTAQAVDMNASKIVVSGTAASPGAEAGPFQIVTVLPERTDGKIYSGVISFTASAPIYVIPGYGFDAENSTLNHADYGELIRFASEASFANVTTAAPEIAHGPILPQYSPQPDSDIGSLPEVYTATVPFAGDLLEVGNVNGTNFLISYTVIADVYETTRVADIGPAIMNTTSGQTPEENSVSIDYGAVERTTDAFSPNPISIQRGDNVTWTNNDFLPHTVTSGTPDRIGTDEAGQEFDSGFLGTRSSFTHTFEERGEFEYFCELHPNMIGTVDVR
jgi:plastocyanin